MFSEVGCTITLPPLSSTLLDYTTAVEMSIKEPIHSGRHIPKKGSDYANRMPAEGCPATWVVRILSPPSFSFLGASLRHADTPPIHTCVSSL